MFRRCHFNDPNSRRLCQLGEDFYIRIISDIDLPAPKRADARCGIENNECLHFVEVRLAFLEIVWIAFHEGAHTRFPIDEGEGACTDALIPFRRPLGAVDRDRQPRVGHNSRKVSVTLFQCNNDGIFPIRLHIIDPIDEIGGHGLRILAQMDV